MIAAVRMSVASTLVAVVVVVAAAVAAAAVVLVVSPTRVCEPSSSVKFSPEDKAI